MSEEKTKLIEARSAIMNLVGSDFSLSNPWSYNDVDKLEIADIKEYREVIKLCRFFYKRDPIGSTVINKMVDIGITDLDFDRSNLNNNAEKLVEGLLPALQEFAEAMALEYLITGLVVPEINFSTENQEKLKLFGIKKFSSLTLPTSMWLRDPATIKINAVVSDKPSYFVEIPQNFVTFITNNGMYPDGTKDENLYNYLLTNYPKLVSSIKNGDRYFPLDNPNIIRRRTLSNSPYPIPYLYGALESMKHKRNIRRMDYSIAARVISAIQLIKVGNDQYPVTEDDTSQIEELKNQIVWRNTAGRDIERIFQLFTNHTVTIEWIFPDVSALLDDTKYKSVNRDIFFALGFPNILVTGETERSGSSNAEIALLSPEKTMNSFRRKIERVLNYIVNETFRVNGLRMETKIRFTPLNLNDFRSFSEAIIRLYETGNISRTSFAKAFGYNLEDELELKVKEESAIKELDIPAFAPTPYSKLPQDTPEAPSLIEEDEEE